MNRIKVKLYGSEYTVVTEEAADYVNSLAEIINRDMTGLLDSSSSMSVMSAALLCSLNYLDESRKAAQSSDHLRSQISEYLEEARRARLEADEARRQILALQTQLELLKGEKGGKA